MPRKNKKSITSRFNNKEVKALLLFISAIVVFLSIVGYQGDILSGLSGSPEHFLSYIGVAISEFLVLRTLGYFSVIIPVIMSIIAYAIFFKKDLKYYINKSIHLSIITLSIFVLFHTYIKPHVGGPIPISIGEFLYAFLTLYDYHLFYILIPILIVILIANFVDVALYDLFMIFLEMLKFLFNVLKKIFSMFLSYLSNVIAKFKTYQENKKLKIEVSNPNELVHKENNINQETKKTDVKDNPKLVQDDTSTIELDKEDTLEEDVIHETDISQDLNSSSIMIEDEVEVEQGDLDTHESRKSKYKNYKLPSTEYLTEPVEISNLIDESILREKAQELVHALETFGVKSKVRKISPGAIITLFEIEPDEGVRVNKFTNLSDDLARVMAAQRIRLIAQIPGTTSVGVELPNNNPAIVYLKTIINSERYINSSSILTIGLGKTTKGDDYTFELD